MPSKILIIDDDKNALRMVGYALHKSGYTVIVASDGKEGLEKAKDESPDLIILDIMMPGMDGYEVARRTRSTPETTSIPILMLTAKSQVEDRVAGFEAGADDFISKPVAYAELLARVKSLLGRVKTEKKSSAPLIGFFGVKGGVGVSTLALNVAVSLAVASHNTVLADFQTSGGSLCMQLGLGHANAFAEFLALKGEHISLKQVREYLLPHQTGLKLLPAVFPRDLPYKPLSLEVYDRVIDAISESSEYVLCDLGMTLDEVHMHLIRLCQRICVVTEQSRISLELTLELLRRLTSAGISGPRINIILIKRERLAGGYSLSELDNILHTRILGMVSPAPELSWQAVEASKPAVILEPDNITSMQYSELARTILL
jgi:CheY-like chemotaxis protein/MinD-like ATPase involved in chromosome partitioning or flagellar assembly